MASFLCVLAVFTIPFLVTVLIVPVLRAVSLRLGLLDTPDGKVKVHSNATPHFGGVAVYVGLCSSLATIWLLSSSLSVARPLFCGVFMPLLASVTILFVVGLVDDQSAMRPKKKFLFQCFAAVVYVAASANAPFLVEHGFVYRLVAGFLILSVVNAFNLVDVMDGLATTIAVGVSLSFLAYAVFFECYSTAYILIGLVGAMLAFFVYNRPVAMMYLGDAGSMLIGGTLGAIYLSLPWGGRGSWTILIPLALLAFPLMEVVLLICLRAYKGIPFYMGSLDHFYVFLSKRGWSKWKILFYSFFMTLVPLPITAVFFCGIISAPIFVFLMGLYAMSWVAVVFGGFPAFGGVNWPKRAK